MDLRYKSFRETVILQGAYKRDYRYYGAYAFCCVVGMVVSILILALFDNPLLQIANAVFFAFVLVQVGMLGHDLSHGQVFVRPVLNRTFAVVVWGLFGGLSESKWYEKHTAHHTNTNEVAEDPDLNIPFIFSDEQREHITQLQRILLPYQHALFFLALPFIYTNQIALAVVHIFRNFSRVTLIELSLIITHFVVVCAIPFILLPVFGAALFLIVHMLAIGMYMSLVFAPNHKGMPVLPLGVRGTWIDQITMTRNVTPSWYTFQILGGLNFQIEHHLFPGVARTRYFTIREPLKRFCEDAGLPYTEVTWRQSIWEIYDALRTVATRGK